MNKIKNLIFVMLCTLAIIWIKSSSLVYAADVSANLTISSVFGAMQVQQVMISNSGDFFNNETGIQNRGNSNDGKWINCTLAPGHNYMEVDNWKLADGNWISDNNWDHSSNLRTVYIKFKDSSGNESSTCSQTIDSTGTEIIDYTKINGGAIYTNSENVTVNFKGDSMYGYNSYGIENVRCGPVSLSTDGGQTWGQQENYSASDWSTPCTLPIGDGIKYINIRGYISTTSSGDLKIATTISIILDKTPPSIKNINVTPQEWTNQAIVTANFSDATSGVVKKLYAPGTKDVSYFKTAGAAVQTINGNSFSVNANGEYSIYAEDGAGNGTVQVVNVNSIGTAMVKLLGGNGNESANVNNLVINSYGSSGYKFELPNTVKDNILKAVNDTKASEAVISVENKSIDVTFPEISSITDADLENGITVLVTVGANNNIRSGQYIASLKMTPGSTDSNFDLTLTPQSSSITPGTVNFDKYTGSTNYKDIPVTMTLNGNTLSSIKNGTSQLTAGTDYSVSGNIVTISKAYLAKQAVGTTSLTFNFNAGNTQTLTVSIADTTPYIPTPVEETIPVTIEVGNGQQNVISINAVRAEDTDGLEEETLSLDENTAKEIVEIASKNKLSEVSIVLPSSTEYSKDKVDMQFSKEFLAELAGANISLNIENGETYLRLSAQTIAGLKDKDEKIDFNKAVETGKINNLISQLGLEGQAVGEPISISNSFNGREKITVPVDAAKFSNKDDLEKYLSSLFALEQDSDGKIVVDKGTIQYDSNGNPTGISVWVSGSECFSMVQLKESYFNGITTIMPDKVAADKEWSIKFTEPANPASITKDNVYVTDSNGNKVAANVSYGSDNTLKVSPVTAFISGETYCLYITKNVTSKDGLPLGSETRVQFNVI